MCRMEDRFLSFMLLQGLNPFRAAFLCSIDVSIKDEKDTSFWFDQWFEGSMLKYKWPNLFTQCKDPLSLVANFFLSQWIQIWWSSFYWGCLCLMDYLKEEVLNHGDGAIRASWWNLSTISSMMAVLIAPLARPSRKVLAHLKLKLFPSWIWTTKSYLRKIWLIEVAI